MTYKIALLAAGLATGWIVVASPVAHLDHHMEFAHDGRTKAELAAGEAKAFDQALLFQVPEVGAEPFRERQIADARAAFDSRPNWRLFRTRGHSSESVG